MGSSTNSAASPREEPDSAVGLSLFTNCGIVSIRTSEQLPFYMVNETGVGIVSYLVIIRYMKTLKCDLCEETAQGETFEGWMKALLPHYMQAHADVMNDPKNGRSEMEKWMSNNKKRFEAVQS